MPERCVVSQRVVPSYDGWVSVYDGLSPSLVVCSGVRQDCPISPFLFNFVIEDVLPNASCGLLEVGVELVPENRDLAQIMPMIAPC